MLPSQIASLLPNFIFKVDIKNKNLFIGNKNVTFAVTFEKL